jgi:SAM-dependent methyltransferase
MPAVEPAEHDAARLPVDRIREIRRTRRHPRPTQFDYLHLRRLLNDLAAALARVRGPVNDVLDVFCGTRPYEDLLPPGARCVGLDVTDAYGAADVVSDEFLPFEDESFDLVLCTEAFHYIADPHHGVSEIKRVLRPGGGVVITVPFVWPYDATILEHRYTGPELAALFDGWDDVEIVENGGRAVAWTTVTGLMVNSLEDRARRPARLARLFHAAFTGAYLAVNSAGAFLDRLERRYASGRYTLPMNLLLSARRPPNAAS